MFMYGDRFIIHKKSQKCSAGKLKLNAAIRFSVSFEISLWDNSTAIFVRRCLQSCWWRTFPWIPSCFPTQTLVFWRCCHRCRPVLWESMSWRRVWLLENRGQSAFRSTKLPGSILKRCSRKRLGRVSRVGPKLCTAYGFELSDFLPWWLTRYTGSGIVVSGRQ